ncbi:PLP-dependent cysteine synthase family protein [Qipengyuania sp. XHP0211]|uniref:PLP-dependent cysteine synthase family protein n=1 Tax=Qipengyuania sp. XHP0211 TaxID=3038079 RepID=UPI00241DA39F|nr:PLP-dependent cysteine synthase family protein [Qipengyuania sp. XHP0211]MDG5750187.1 PLP-dependent cysteine synthase family protein [Qipengyuania sp. XHP0211]
MTGKPRANDRGWVNWAIGRIEADFTRSADTHLIPLPVPALPDIAIYLKDESSHPTGSLKHRLARSLFLYGLCNGWICEGTPVIEASSGSTAVSEAYFARMLGLRFIAVVPRSTAKPKIEAIQFHGGECHFVDAPGEMYAAAQALADDLGGHYIDQFTFAERATDWRANNNIAESIFAQMAREPHPVPRWIVCGAGTGGTSATIGRFARYNRHDTKVCVADPEGSVFHRHWADRSVTRVEHPSGCIEGIGRQRVEPSFLPDVIDRMEAVPDACSIAAAHEVSDRLGRRCGGSTGTNVWACAMIAAEMAARGEAGSIVSILCDDGARYADTIFEDGWLDAKGLSVTEPRERIGGFFDKGDF